MRKWQQNTESKLRTQVVTREQVEISREDEKPIEPVVDGDGGATMHHAGLSSPPRDMSRR